MKKKKNEILMARRKSKKFTIIRNIIDNQIIKCEITNQY